MPTRIFIFLFQLRLILYLVTQVPRQPHKDGIWDWLNHVFNLECNAKFKENTSNPWHAMPSAITIKVSPAVDKVPTQGNILHFLHGPLHGWHLIYLMSPSDTGYFLNVYYDDTTINTYILYPYSMSYIYISFCIAIRCNIGRLFLAVELWLIFIFSFIIVCISDFFSNNFFFTFVIRKNKVKVIPCPPINALNLQLSQHSVLFL